VKVQKVTVTRNHLHNTRKHVKISYKFILLPNKCLDGRSVFPHLPYHISINLVRRICIALLQLTDSCSVRGKYSSSFTNLKKPNDKGVGSEELGSMESVLHAQSSCQETMPSNRQGHLYGSVVVGHVLQPRYHVIFQYHRGSKYGGQ